MYSVRLVCGYCSILKLKFDTFICCIVQFYPWFDFYFSLFDIHYHILISIEKNNGQSKLSQG